jgi:hypothetical protein
VFSVHNILYMVAACHSTTAGTSAVLFPQGAAPGLFWAVLLSNKRLVLAACLLCSVLFFGARSAHAPVNLALVLALGPNARC